MNDAQKLDRNILIAEPHETLFSNIAAANLPSKYETSDQVMAKPQSLASSQKNDAQNSLPDQAYIAYDQNAEQDAFIN